MDAEVVVETGEEQKQPQNTITRSQVRGRTSAFRPPTQTRYQRIPQEGEEHKERTYIFSPEENVYFGGCCGWEIIFDEALPEEIIQLEDAVVKETQGDSDKEKEALAGEIIQLEDADVKETQGDSDKEKEALAGEIIQLEDAVVKETQGDSAKEEPQGEADALEFELDAEEEEETPIRSLTLTAMCCLCQLPYPVLDCSKLSNEVDWDLEYDIVMDNDLDQNEEYHGSDIDDTEEPMVYEMQEPLEILDPVENLENEATDENLENEATDSSDSNTESESDNPLSHSRTESEPKRSEKKRKRNNGKRDKKRPKLDGSFGIDEALQMNLDSSKDKNEPTAGPSTT
jgi:hypothetical protein